MRHLTLAFLLALGLAAYAEEAAPQAEVLRPRIPRLGVGAIQKKLAIPSAIFERWQLLPSRKEQVEGKIAELNRARQDLIEQYQTAEQKLLEARKELNAALAKLEAQRAELEAYLRETVGAKAQDLDILMQVMPLKEWLDLSDDTVSRLVDSLKRVVQNNQIDGKDPRDYIAEAARTARETTVEQLTTEERKTQIQRLQAFKKFQEEWISTIEATLPAEKRDLWNRRYRRALGVR
ncbi:MAG: hypothetical protein ACLF0G_16570 [Candidatus Brocadiia bacterium]